MNKKTLVICFLVLITSIAQSQETQPITLTLSEVIIMAKNNSPEAKRAKTTLDNRYWSYRSFRSNYLPQLALNGSLPDLSRSISSITLDDGTESFLTRTSNNGSLEMRLSQNIGLTGGSLGISSQLQRQEVEVNQGSSSTNYRADPALISLNQPLLSFNSLRWDKRIEPMRYEESKREYNENMEGVAVQATELFFNLLIAQKSYEIAEKNLANNDTLFQIAKGRYNLGKIAENDLLQMELSVMNAQNSLSQATLDINQANLRLAIFLGLTGKETVKLVPPYSFPEFEVNVQKALEYALANRKEALQFSRQKLEAERDVARARGESGLNLNLSASYGLTNSAPVFDDVYNQTQDQQGLRLGFSIPIVDWGRSKSQLKTAVANKELIDLNVQQDQQNFEQGILLLVQRFKMSKQQLVIAQRSEEVAEKRYQISKKRYQIGKIDILDLNIALQEKDQAKRGYMQALQNYWGNYYELRRRTLYDFHTNTEIRN